MVCHYVLCLSIMVLDVTSTITPTGGSSNQYHIQNDEGPERYFRYQTDSGQYRKEKRLRDGTIVGTYAWIDGNGFLQQSDYIADNTGYRILRTKNLFVGQNVPIGQAVKSISKFHASVNNPSNLPFRNMPHNAVTSSASNSQQMASPPAVSSTDTIHINHLVNAIVPSTTINTATSTQEPIVAITSNSASLPLRTLSQHLQNHTAYINSNDYLSTTPFSTELSPSFPSYIQRTTPAEGNSKSLSIVSSTEQSRERGSLSYARYNDAPKKLYNSLETNIHDLQDKRFYSLHNGPTYSLDRSDKLYFGDNLRNEYSVYNSVLIANDGFRYYIPRAYHEEKSLPGDGRSGSFGYIDPFGIRRIIYYNTSPGSGFQFRKNNRYVGFHAAPYDPRPY